jgi:hypothetical protein
VFGPGRRNGSVFIALNAGMLELFGEPIPVPFAVTAEVAVTAVDPNARTTCWGGVYAGGVSWVADGESLHGLTAAVVYSDQPVADGAAYLLPYRGSLDVLWWAGERPFSYLSPRSLGQTRVRKLNGAPVTLDWHQLRVEVRPRSIGAAVFGGPVATADWTRDIARHGTATFRSSPWAVGDPHVPTDPGAGIGLVVRGAELHVRNLNLIPLTQ